MDGLASSGETEGSLEDFRGWGGQFLFAANRRDRRELVYLEQGAAEEQRAFARTRLMCPEPDCSAPEITTVYRAPGGRRDGYRHLSRPDRDNHGPESVLHRQGKALVARWAGSQPRVAKVQIEAPLADRERVADVLITSETGNRIAIEVQYSGLTNMEWKQRTASYNALGIPVVWIWGNVGTFAPRRTRVLDVHREVLRRRMPIIWINPAQETIAWAGLEDDYPRLLAPNVQRHGFWFGSLDDLELRATGLFPPGFIDARIALKAARARRQRRLSRAFEQKVDQIASGRAQRSRSQGEY